MGSYYYTYALVCPYCDKVVDEVVYFTNAYDTEGQEQGFDTGWCNHCKKKFRIDMEFKLSKLEE